MHRELHLRCTPAEMAVSTAQPLVLLVDDDHEMLGVNTHYLRKNGYRVVHATSAAAAWELVQPDLNCIVLNTHLPDMSGFELASRFRTISSAPILFLTAANGDDYMARGFRVGDDYMVKPHNLKELSLRIGVHIRRNAAMRAVSELSYPPLLIDIDNRLVSIEGKEVLMPPKEFSILAALARVPNRVVSFDLLFRKVWQTSECCNRHVLAVNVSTLRKRLTSAQPGFDFIHTEWGTGYSFAYPPTRTE